jgi:peptide methionine sulfoxide reductase MsrB
MQMHHSFADAPAPLHHQHHCITSTTYPFKKNFSQKTHNNTQPG